MIVRGRFPGRGGPQNWISAGIVRIVGGVPVEHWEVLQDEASRGDSKSGRPMFGADFSELALHSSRPRRAQISPRKRFERWVVDGTARR